MKAKAWKKAGIHVLHLRGTHTEMAAQHGALLKDEIHRGAIPFLGQRNFDTMAQSPLFRDRPRFHKFATSLIRLLIQKPMLAHAPRVYIEEARAIAKASGVPYEYFEQSLLQADTLVLLIRFFLGRVFMGQMAMGTMPGCTSAIAVKDASKSGQLIHGRNMDYPVVGRWDTYPTVMYYDPEGIDKGQRYIGISSAGVHTAGVTGINESGITLSAHFHCGKHVSPFGTPIQFIGAEVIKKAKTLGQAIDIANDLNRAGSWSLVVSSAKENDAAIIEMMHGKISVLPPENGVLAHSNHYHTRDFQNDELMLCGGITNDCHYRYTRAMDLLGKARGGVDRETIARILGDSFDDETGRVRGHGNTISVVTTITSMISEPSEGRFWVGNSGKSPTCLGDYAGFKIDETFEGFDSYEAPIHSWNPVGAATIRGTPKQVAFEHFRDAYVAFHTDYDVPRAAEAAGRAAAADPEEGHYHLAHGHFLMRLEKCDAALESFRKAGACKMSAHMSHVAMLFFGHALDCVGKRDEARAQYEQVIRLTTDPHLRKEAKRCHKQGYKAERAWNMTFDLQFCDTLEYA